MYSRPAEQLADTPLAREARDLIRSCVHCGFCLPACPTYRVTGNELDSPRGRIYLIKEMLERGSANATARRHLDRCLTCRACETACPSGVQYGRLADLGREFIEQQPPGPRPTTERFVRFALASVAARRALFTPLVRIGQAVRPGLPASLASLLPPRAGATVTDGAAPMAWPAARHSRRLAVLEGCVQPGLAPQINAAAARVLDRFGISLVAAREVGCCGALEHHLGGTDAALAQVRRNVAASARLLDGVAMRSRRSDREHGERLRCVREGLRPRAAARRSDDRGAGRARGRGNTGHLRGGRPADLRQAIAVSHASSVAGGEATSAAARQRLRVAWQAPCSLQHGQRQTTAGRVEALLLAAGCELVPVRNPTLCCGSAGTYSILQPELSNELRSRKLESLVGDRPDVIATANIGCLEHLRQVSTVPVRHWIEIVDDALRQRGPAQP